MSKTPNTQNIEDLILIQEEFNALLKKLDAIREARPKYLEKLNLAKTALLFSQRHILDVWEQELKWTDPSLKRLKKKK